MAFQFTVDPRNGITGSGSPCCASNCCCAPASVVPGETNRWTINYQSWLATLGGRGLCNPTVLSITRLTPNDPPSSPSDLPPVNTDYVFTVNAGAVLSSTIANNADDPENATLAFALSSPPINGTVLIHPDGTFLYVSRAGFSGIDTFEFTTSDGVNRPILNRATIAVSTTAAPSVAAPASGLLTVPQDRILVRNPILFFAVVASPQIVVGDVYRMTIKQAAMDCDAAFFQHVSCYDISVLKC